LEGGIPAFIFSKKSIKTSSIWGERGKFLAQNLVGKDPDPKKPSMVQTMKKSWRRREIAYRPVGITPLWAERKSTEDKRFLMPNVQEHTIWKMRKRKKG